MAKKVNSNSSFSVFEQKSYIASRSLIEPALSRDDVTEHCFYLDADGFRNVAEERYLDARCGYVLCDNVVTVGGLHSKYSIKSNRVYLNEERRWFCSEHCYTAYRYLEVQLSQETHWTLSRGAKAELKFIEDAPDYVPTYHGREVKLDVGSLIARLNDVDLNESAEDMPSRSLSCVNGAHSEPEKNEQTLGGATSVDDEPNKPLISKEGTKSIPDKLPSSEERRERGLNKIRERHFVKGDNNTLVAKKKLPMLIDPLPLTIAHSVTGNHTPNKGDVTLMKAAEEMILSWVKTSPEAGTVSLDSMNKRRRILFEQLAKKFVPIFSHFGMDFTNYKTDMRDMLFNLNLGSNAIKLKPQQSTYAAYVMLVLLAKIVPEVQLLLSSDEGQLRSQSLMSSLGYSMDDFNRFYSKLV